MKITNTANPGTGIEGKNDNGNGVVGSATNGNGVRGIGVNGTGVLGESTGSLGTGVMGTSLTGSGVYGLSTAGNSLGTGVYGTATLGRGVRGVSTSGVGVEGQSTNSDGGYMFTSSSSHSGLYVQNLASGGGGWGVFSTATGSGHAIHGANSNGAGYGGYFEGKVHSDGEVDSSSGFTGPHFNISSDARLKKDVADLAYGLKDIAALHSVSFSWKDPASGTGRQLGFIAQDIQKVVPEIVKKDGQSGMLAVNYTALVPVLVKAIQEQQATIQKQEVRIARLEQGPVMSSIFSGGMGTVGAFSIVSTLVFLAFRRRRDQGRA